MTKLVDIIKDPKLNDAITKALLPNGKTTIKVTPEVVDDVHKVVAKQVQPVIDHLTNQEAHWWQKRSFWSAIVSIVGVVAAPLATKYGLEGYLTPENLDTVVETVTRVAGVVAAYLAWRAGTAIKPLGK